MDGKALRDKLVGSKDERAVSPVIGVILMVAITVILAAVIATLVMDIGDNTQSAVTASVDTNGDGTDTIDLSVTDGGNADNLVVVGSNGEVIGNSQPANTGATYTVTANNSSGDFGLASGDAGDVRVYAIQGNLSDSNPLDAAEASTEVAEFEVTT